MEKSPNEFRLLVVDDNPAIYQDIVKILASEEDDKEIEHKELLAKLFGSNPKPTKTNLHYTIDSAFQGADAVKLVQNSIENDKPYALAFIDILMPPGMDGVETTKSIWKIDPDIQVVICTAYGDYSWNELTNQLGINDNFLILKKPFDSIEVRQLACCLAQKWYLNKQVGHTFDRLHREIEKKSSELENWT